MCGCIGYVNTQDRRSLCKRAAACLCPGGTVFVDVMMLDRPDIFEDRLVAQSRIGAHRYDIYLSGALAQGYIMLWIVRFEVYDGDRKIKNCIVQRGWYTFGLEQVLRARLCKTVSFQRLF